jgi:uroporphyrinogen decarboxylase
MTMRMTARERVCVALAHQQPDRVPFSWGFGPTPEMTVTLEQYLVTQQVDWTNLRNVTDDILTVSPRYIGKELPVQMDIWGIQRRVMDYGTGHYDEIAAYPLAELSDTKDIEHYSWPDPSQYDYDAFRHDILVADPGGCKAHKLNIDVCGNPMEIYSWLTGLENALINMISRPMLVHAAMEAITSFFEAKLRRTLPGCDDLIDILYFADDLGGQTGLLISRGLYQALVQPYHARLIRLAKQLAPHARVMLHSDGAVFDILPDLIQTGVEVMEAVQTDAAGMSPERLKQTYGSLLCFLGGISVQSLLPHGTEKTVFDETRRLVQVFGQGGGYIAAPTHAIQVMTPPQNVVAMLKAVLGEDDFETALTSARR